MKTRSWMIFAFSLLGLSGLGIGVQACLNAEAASTAPAMPRATTDELGGADRYLAYVSTDKPIYRAGETVYLRAVVLDARTHKPFAAEQLWATLEILGPKGETITSSGMQTQGEALGTSWPVADSAAGGDTRRGSAFRIMALRPPSVNSTFASFAPRA